MVITNKYILDEIKKAFILHGAFLKKDLDSFIPFSASLVVKRFRSLSNIERILGIKFRNPVRIGRPSISKKKIVSDIKDAFLRYGKLYKKDINKYTSFCKETVLNKFGSFDKFEKESGVSFKKGYIKGLEHKNKISLAFKGKTMDEILGCKKAKRRNEKISLMLKGNKNNKRYILKDNIVNEVKEAYKIHGRFFKSEFNLFVNVCSVTTVRNKFGSLDELADIAMIVFRKNKRGIPNIGLSEKAILDNIEKEKGIKLIRQFTVNGKFVDGYDKINNIVYEVDEAFHKYRRVEDFIRENKIRDVLGCEFIRIKCNEVSMNE